jgi:CRISPR-associated protein Csb2
MTHLLLTVRLLDDRYHGLLADGGPPEWPPSPFRLFCALVAGLARRGELEGEAGKALTWLQTLAPPIIIAPKAKKGQAITRYVPNNDGDKWPDRQDRLGTKPTIPTMFLLPPNQNPELHYLWQICQISDVPFEHVRTAARSLTALGWGIDMAFADAKLVEEEEIQRLSGSRWHPMRADGHGAGIVLRVPTADAHMQECTLSDLKQCHETAMQRIGLGEPLHTVDEPRVFDRVFYERDRDPLGRPYAAFRLLQPDTGKNQTYAATDPVKVAGMIRCAAGKAALDSGRPKDWVDEFVYGHHEGAESFPRFSYLPLPSIQPVVGVGRINRVLIAEPIGAEGNEVAWIKRLLAGHLANNEQGRHALLMSLPHDDNVLKQYRSNSQTWNTVTPVALPGSDDGIASKTSKLLAKMLNHAGYSPDSVEELEYHRVPFCRGAEDAKRYRPRAPHHLANCTMYHMRIRWKFPMPGPIALGAGRHCGLGVFAAIE